MARVTINDLLEAGCHFGHRTRRWNPKMKPYVYGAKNGIYIIDLTKTMRQLAAACNFLQHTVADGQDILFVGTKRQAQEIVRDAAARTGMHHVTERWLGGTLTNNKTIRNSIRRMQEIDTLTQSSEGPGLKKKEMASLSRQSVKLHRNLDGIAGMRRLPGAIVVMDACHESIAVKEANKLGIPIVALIDTNADPDLIDYPVVANDDAVKSIKVVADLFADAIASTLDQYRKRVAEDEASKEAAEAKAKAKAKPPRGRGDRGERKPGGRRRPGGRTAAAPAAAREPRPETAAPPPAESPAEAPPASAEKPAEKKPERAAGKKPAKAAPSPHRPAGDAKKPHAKKPAAKKSAAPPAADNAK